MVRIALGLVFVFSGTTKILDLESFSRVIEAFGIIPWEFKTLAALVISSLEILAGAGLVFDIRASLSTVFIMLLIFMAVLGYGIAMGYDIDCGCFGENDPVGDAFHGLYSALGRDLIFLAAVIYLYIWRRQNDAVLLGPVKRIRCLYGNIIKPGVMNS